MFGGHAHRKKLQKRDRRQMELSTELISRQLETSTALQETNCCTHIFYVLSDPKEDFCRDIQPTRKKNDFWQGKKVCHRLWLPGVGLSSRVQQRGHRVRPGVAGARRGDQSGLPQTPRWRFRQSSLDRVSIRRLQHRVHAELQRWSGIPEPERCAAAGRSVPEPRCRLVHMPFNCTSCSVGRRLYKTSHFIHFHPMEDQRGWCVCERKLDPVECCLRGLLLLQTEVFFLFVSIHSRPLVKQWTSVQVSRKQERESQVCAARYKPG